MNIYFLVTKNIFCDISYKYEHRELCQFDRKKIRSLFLYDPHIHIY